MKKHIAYLLIVLLLLTTVSGCAENDSPSSESPASETPEAAASSQPTEDAAEPPDTGEPVKERTYISYPLAEELVELTAYVSIDNDMIGYVEDYNTSLMLIEAEAATNVHVDWTTTGTQFEEQFRIMMTAGNLPDLVMYPEENYSGGIDALIEQEIVYDLAPYLETCAPDFYEVYTSDSLYASGITSDSGSLTTMWGRSSTVDQGMVIRKDLLDKAGLEVPATYDELYDVLTVFSSEYGMKDALGLLQYGYMFPMVTFFIGGYGLSVFETIGDLPYQVDDNGNVEMSFMKDEYRDYLAMLSKWYSEGFFSSDFLSWNIPRYINVGLQSGDIGVGVFGPDCLTEAYSQSTGIDGFQLIPIADFTLTGTETITMGDSRGIYTFGGLAVSTNCSDLELAISYLNWFWTEEGNFAANYGQDGVSFNYENGEVVYTDLIINNSDGAGARVALKSYVGFPSLGFDVAPDRYAKTYESDIQKSCHEVWVSNRSEDNVYNGNLTVEESEIYSQYIQDIATFTSEEVPKFILGERSLDTWDEFVEQIISMDVETLLELKQAAYDRYLQRDV